MEGWGGSRILPPESKIPLPFHSPLIYLGFHLLSRFPFRVSGVVASGNQVIFYLNINIYFYIPFMDSNFLPFVCIRKATIKTTMFSYFPE
jgi:hypothetical protein